MKMILTTRVTNQDSLDTKIFNNYREILHMDSTSVPDLEYFKQSHLQEGHGPC